MAEEEELTNLALNKKYTINTPYPVDSQFGPVEDSWPDNGGLLTDGEYGGTDFTNNKFIGQIWQSGRSIILDLEDVSTVQDLSLNFLQDKANGISHPLQVEYSVSMNGKEWEKVGVVDSETSPTNSELITQKYECY